MATRIWSRPLGVTDLDGPDYKIKAQHPDRYHKLKQAIVEDLQQFKRPDGLHFMKRVFFIRGIK
mgnify:CR=1 FL=1